MQESNKELRLKINSGYARNDSINKSKLQATIMHRCEATRILNQKCNVQTDPTIWGSYKD